MQVSAIIPAYNEAERIEAVLKPLKQSKTVQQIIVVDDGSTDETACIARTMGVEVRQLPLNGGKAAALNEGVHVASNEILLFLDADLVGLRPQQIDELAHTYFRQKADMVVGVFKNGRLNTDLSQIVAPYLSGQRILSKTLWKRLQQNVDYLDFGVEIALKKLSIKEGWCVVKVELDGVTHVMKEEKRGLSQGLKDRFKMYGDIVRSVFTKVE